MKEVCVEKRIEEVANTKIGGKYNLVQYKKEKEKMMIHKSVCQAVLAFRDKNVHMPMYAILSCGISAGAFKNEEFEKGYKHFDAEKAKTIFEMAKAYKGKPTVLIADTVKGKGVSFMEGDCNWHGNAPNAQQLEQALKEVKGEG